MTQFLSLTLLCACNAPPQSAGPICRTSRAAIASNAIAVNGITMQGTALNGITTNRITANGMTLQGKSTQGMTLQGKTLQGMNLQGMTLQGMTLQGITMQGTTLTGLATGEALDVVGGKITGVTERDERIELNFTAMEQDGDLTYYSLATNDGWNICGENGKGLFVPGIWDLTGKHHSSLGEGETFRDTSFSCTTGVIAKCVTWGYEPWANADLHQACTRMARADYCGNGVPHTENGTLIDIFDVEGIQISAMSDELEFEAGWGPDGAVCVHKTRYTDINQDRRVVRPECWSDKPTCESFEGAIQQGALIANESGRSSRYICAE